MTGPDLSLITNAPNLTDRIMQQQQFSNQQGAAQIEVKTKQNLYASQIMGAAAASGDPQRIQMAKQALAQSNIDPSSWSDDPAQVKLQATALQQSLMSPLGVLNAGIQKEKADAETAGTNGTKAPGFTGISAPSLNSSVQPSGGQGAPLPASVPVANLPVFAQSASGQPPSSAPPNLNAPINAAAPSIPQQPSMNDSKYSALNPKTAVDVFKADMDAYNNRPDVIQAKKTAEAEGAKAGELPIKAATASSLSDRIMKGLDALDSINEQGKLPYSGVLDSDTKAFLSNKFGNLPGGDNQEAARAYQNFADVNKQQVVVSLQDMLAAAPAGSRMSQALIGIINQANGVQTNASQASIRDQIGILRNEVKNIGISEENTNAKINGGSVQQYNSIPTSMAAPDDPITAELRKRGVIK